MLAMHSDVLRSLFFGGMAEAEAARAGVSTLRVPWPRAAVRLFVTYCQTGVVQVDKGTIVDAILIADYCKWTL